MTGIITAVSESSEADVDRAPICPHCGVTALPADIATVLDSHFVCENPDCDAFGDFVEPNPEGSASVAAQRRRRR